MFHEIKAVNTQMQLEEEHVNELVSWHKAVLLKIDHKIIKKKKM